MKSQEFVAWAQKLDTLLASARHVSIVTHINPDADTIGTGLGIYRILQHRGDLAVEVVNVSGAPSYLDFLPGFEAIKSACSFDGLVIACDGADASRFGIDFEGRTVVNIDHHAGNTRFGTLNVVSDFASCGETAYELFRHIGRIDADAAQCFYTALFSDSRQFTTDTVNAETFRRAKELTDVGADPLKTARALTQRKSLASLRLLQRALASLQLCCDATTAIMALAPEDFETTGAHMSDMEGIVEYGRSLATVDISVLIAALPDASVRVSLRSKYEDVARIAAKLGGGGHKHAAGIMLKEANPQQIRDTIVRYISETKKEEAYETENAT